MKVLGPRTAPRSRLAAAFIYLIFFVTSTWFVLCRKGFYTQGFKHIHGLSINAYGLFFDLSITNKPTNSNDVTSSSYCLLKRGK